MSRSSSPLDGVRSAFEDAVYEVQFPEGSREFHTGAQRALAPPFVIVTAWNPAGEELCLDENLARNVGLKAAIAARGWRWHPAESRAPEGSHVEPGYAILGAPPGEAEALAARFGQFAVFVWDGHEGRIAWLDPESAGSPHRARGIKAQSMHDDNHGE